MNRLVTSPEQLSDLLGIPFTEHQLVAITAPLDVPTAIIAGAGSGKTTVMAARVLWLVGHEGIPPERILGLTFTNKAAAELGQRIRASVARLEVDPAALGWGDPTTATYHAFAGSLITEHGLRLGIEPDLRIVTDASRFQRFARAVEGYAGEIELLSTYVPWLVANAPKLDAELAEHLVTTDDLRAYDNRVIALDDWLPSERPPKDGHSQKVIATAAAAARKRGEIAALVDAYRAAKAADGVMDFSDQMAWGAALAQVAEVRDAMRERFDVVLLDEYQDTSVAQRDLLVGLFHGMPVTAVGDPAQGIYGWRGAATGNLEDFLDDFSDGVHRSEGESSQREVPPGRRLTLLETRRCRPEIIAAANDIISDFYRDASVTKAVEPLTSAKPPGGSVSVALHETVSDEIAALVEQIRAIRDAGEIPLKQIAILVRATRENGEIVMALREAHIPFEIVGLQGLLIQPEVLDVLSLLEVVADATANPAVLRLLTGPRWNIGPRDLALLGERASSLSRAFRGEDADGDLTLASALAKAVEGTDPTEIVSLADALADLGDLPYSADARRRFAEVAAVISSLRRHTSDPLLDLARRAVRALDLDIELEAGDVEGGGDNLALFLDAVAAYSETDRYASLSGLLAYLSAEEQYNFGMEVSTPSEAESVKLLTVHRAKGLEWHTVFVPLMARTVFPSALGRPNWLTNMLALPTALRGDRNSLPQMPDDPEHWTDAAAAVHNAQVKDLAAMEERRLAYVAYTRAAERLVLSGHWWGRTQLKPLGPSEFLTQTREWLAERGVSPVVWADEPEPDAVNPHLAHVRTAAWPVPQPTLARRHALADAVRAALAQPSAPVVVDDVAMADRLNALEHDLDLLLAEADAANAGRRNVALPLALSTTSMLTLAQDPAKLARDLARPMPRQPSPAARLGTRFHAWVEAHYGQQVLLDPTDLPGRGDVNLASDEDLADVIERFRAGPYGDRAPVAIEAPFSLVLAGQQVVGRIDAIFERDGAIEVVDWKTNRSATADPLQLAVYRLAWAEMNGLDLADVTGAFYYVRLGEVQRFDDLPGREELERVLAGESVAS
ncbi:MAG TPA: UvrD-helicase domain-containing protein [Aeromicrobium sp.]|nr:UvrD-helicase domain-containing protein [Aeromicrobium sp.]HKY57021.1 UvrD-helicase domain-containing protein [Aeromicrobium sp.]